MDHNFDVIVQGVLNGWQGLVPVADAAIDLSGVWSCDDGGLYFVRQIGPDVMWYGEAGPGVETFANVAHGHVEHGQVRLTWADVPKGSGWACGALVLDVESHGKLAAIRSTGGFGGQVWTR